jgi:hypothetical protein
MTPKGASGAMLEAMDHVGDAGGLDVVATGSELVIIVLELSIEQFDLVEDLVPLLSIAADALNLGEVLPLVEPTHRVTECVVLGHGAVDEVGEPPRERLDRVRGRIVGGCVKVDDIRFFFAGPA